MVAENNERMQAALTTPPARLLRHAIAIGIANATVDKIRLMRNNSDGPHATRPAKVNRPYWPSCKSPRNSQNIGTTK
jgi:hypothetical protein